MFTSWKGETLKKRLREHEASDATNIRHKNSLFSESTSAAFFVDKVLLKYFDAQIFGSLRLTRIHTLMFSLF